MEAKNFGAFLAKLAEKSDVATTETLKGIKERLEKQKQEQLEKKLFEVYSYIEQEVRALRQLRLKERQHKARIKALSEAANQIVAGEDVRVF